MDKVVFSEECVAHVGRERREQLITLTHALVEIPELLQGRGRHLDHSGVPVAPAGQSVRLDAGDDLVHVETTHAKAAAVARHGTQQLDLDELDSTAREP